MKLWHFSNIYCLAFIWFPGFWAVFIFDDPYFVYNLVVLRENKVECKQGGM